MVVDPIHETDRHGLSSRAIEALLDLLYPGADLPGLDAVARHIDVDPNTMRETFPNQGSLVEAAVDEGVSRVLHACVSAVVMVDPDDSVGQYKAIAAGYLTWAAHDPRHFLLCCDRSLAPLVPGGAIQRVNDAMKALMRGMLERSQAEARIDPGADLEAMMLSSRAFVYGLARMIVDQHMDEWYLTDDPLDAALRAMELHIDQLSELQKLRVQLGAAASPAAGAAAAAAR